MRKFLSFNVNITKATVFITKPQRKNIVNSIDKVSEFYGVSRVPGEGNPELRDRLWDAFVNPGGPTYQGTENSLTRDFGFIKNIGLTIDLKKDSDGDMIAENPRVEVKGTKTILYKNWTREGDRVIDKEIRTYQPEDPGYFLIDLISEINTSECFLAEIGEEITNDKLFSSMLVNANSSILISKENIGLGQRTRLAIGNIVKGSLRFQDNEFFKTEVFSSFPNEKGQYLIDYKDGVIYTFEEGKRFTEVSYRANVFPLPVEISPVQVYSLQDDEFRFELFEKKTLDSGEEREELLNHEGASIYHELYKTTEVFWGN